MYIRARRLGDVDDVFPDGMKAELDALTIGRIGATPTTPADCMAAELIALGHATSMTAARAAIEAAIRPMLASFTGISSAKDLINYIATTGTDAVALAFGRVATDAKWVLDQSKLEERIKVAKCTPADVQRIMAVALQQGSGPSATPPPPVATRPATISPAPVAMQMIRTDKAWVAAPATKPAPSPAAESSSLALPIAAAVGLLLLL